MYSLISQISSVFSKPFFSMANSLESWPIVFALILGVVGALVSLQGILVPLHFMAIVPFKRK